VQDVAEEGAVGVRGRTADDDVCSEDGHAVSLSRPRSRRIRRA
jgi:hypothetical protein